ncbi:MBOAT family protein [Aquimarina sp. AD10]|uniref:MBOAT family O-acyltransferase n=1 Tax=Aquimarina sp. AD10 TaxID=1714849 RepID=UPI001314408B|nr:MBOAT family O-acyltransferase [Aquimarina sp. AD10]
MIVFSGFVDFFAAILINGYRKHAKLFLILSFFVNLMSLSVFKYSSFLADQFENIFEIFSISIQLKDKLPEFTYILPVGISFYTFQSMSYTIDVYRKNLKPTNNVLHFFSYLVMFPQLVAGPIIRAKDFLEQLNRERKVSGIEFWNGIKLIIIGYFQKTVIADNLGVFVDHAFAGVNNQPGLYWWIVMLCFAFQIYFDFSGYSQIARGLAKLMGYHFKMNFNHPYLAISLRDFWNRWHISLSTWFRDFVYIPLGGSKKGRLKSHINMWITMLLSGLWHGANINFILWGGFHAAGLSIERIIKQFFTKSNIKVASFITGALTIIYVLIAWVFFRSTSIEQIGTVLGQMFQLNLNYNFIEENINPLIFLLLAFVAEGSYYFEREVASFKRFKKQYDLEVFQYSLMICAIVFFRGPEQEFIYFQF